MGTEGNVAALVNDERDDLETMSNEETRSQCKALAKRTGKRCKKTASPGSEYCPVHQRMAGRRAQQANTERTPPEARIKVGKPRITVGDAYEMSPEEFEALAARPKVAHATASIVYKMSPKEAKALLEAIDAESEVAEEAAPTLPEEEAEVAKRPEWPLNDPTWREQAAFSLWFGHVTDEHGKQVWRTCVYHESGEQKAMEQAGPIAKKDFTGVVTDPWVNWILERARLPVAAEPIPTEIEAAVPPAPVRSYDAQLEILDVQVSQVTTPPGVRGKKLMAEVRFQISGPERATLVAERLPFQIEVHTIDVESEAAHLVASERSRLQPQVFEYTSHQEFPIPDLGRYELQSIVLLLPPGEMLAFRQDAPFRVVP